SGSILAVAERLGLAERGRAVVAAERARLDAVRAATAHRPRPNVALLEWTDPLFVMGNWMPEVVMAAGGTPLLAHPGDYSSATTFECVRDADPMSSSSRRAGFRSRARSPSVTCSRVIRGGATCAPCAMDRSSSPMATASSIGRA